MPVVAAVAAAYDGVLKTEGFSVRSGVRKLNPGRAGPLGGGGGGVHLACFVLGSWMSRV